MGEVFMGASAVGGLKTETGHYVFNQKLTGSQWGTEFLIRAFSTNPKMIIIYSRNIVKVNGTNSGYIILMDGSNGFGEISNYSMPNNYVAIKLLGNKLVAIPGKSSFDEPMFDKYPISLDYIVFF